MTKSRAIYVFMLFASLMYTYFYGGKLPYMLLYTVLLLPLISFAYTLLILFRFKYSQELDKKFVTKGDKVNFIFTITNEDFFIYPYVKISFFGAKTVFENQSEVRCFSLMPFSSRNFSFELQCNYRGRYDIGVSSIEFEDILGLFRLKYKINEPMYVTVYPRVICLDRFFLKMDFMFESNAVLNVTDEDMTTMDDVRKYNYGDSLKRVHWKLTAKTGEIMVKKFQGTSEANIVMFVDLHKTPYPEEENIIIEDKLIEAVVSVLSYCLRRWIPVNLVYYDDKLVNIHAENHMMFNEIYESIARVKFNSDVKVKDLVEIFAKGALRKTNILIFTANLDYELYNTMYKALCAGYDVSIIYVSPEKLMGTKNRDVESILSSLPEIGIAGYVINTDDEVKKVLER